jgi:hypothetical protein
MGRVNFSITNFHTKYQTEETARYAVFAKIRQILDINLPSQGLNNRLESVSFSRITVPTDKCGFALYEYLRQNRGERQADSGAREG